METIGSRSFNMSGMDRPIRNKVPTSGALLKIVVPKNRSSTIGPTVGEPPNSYRDVIGRECVKKNQIYVLFHGISFFCCNITVNAIIKLIYPHKTDIEQDLNDKAIKRKERIRSPWKFSVWIAVPMEMDEVNTKKNEKGKVHSNEYFCVLTEFCVNIWIGFTNFPFG